MFASMNFMNMSLDTNVQAVARGHIIHTKKVIGDK